MVGVGISVINITNLKTLFGLYEQYFLAGDTRLFVCG